MQAVLAMMVDFGSSMVLDVALLVLVANGCSAGCVTGSCDSDGVVAVTIEWHEECL